MPETVGVDLGGTKMAVGVLDSDRRVLYRSTAYGTVGLPASVTLTPDSTGQYLLLTYNSPNGLVSGWIDHGKLRFLPARHPNSELLITGW